MGIRALLKSIKEAKLRARLYSGLTMPPREARRSRFRCRRAARRARRACRLASMNEAAHTRFDYVFSMTKSSTLILAVIGQYSAWLVAASRHFAQLPLDDFARRRSAT